MTTSCPQLCRIKLETLVVLLISSSLLPSSPSRASHPNSFGLVTAVGTRRTVVLSYNTVLNTTLFHYYNPTLGKLLHGLDEA